MIFNRKQELSLTLLIIIIAIAVGQIHYLRLEGRFRRYLKLYLSMVGCLALLAATQSLHLRIHHCILALLLLPGIAIQTRPDLLYQGLLIGLFINGIALWGLASILQTKDALPGGDGKYRLLLPAVMVSPTAKAMDFQWEPQPPQCAI
jgi:hypothetical protein